MSHFKPKESEISEKLNKTFFKKVATDNAKRN